MNPNCDFFVHSVKLILSSGVLSRFHAILVTENQTLSDPDPKLITPDPDPANNSALANLDPRDPDQLRK